VTGTDEGAADPLRVVVADDTADIRSLLRVILTRSGFDVVGEAANGREAVAVAMAERPDVVLMDLAMPVMDGLEAIPLIRKDAPTTKIVVLSGFQREQMEAEARAAGADAYVEKGTTPAELVSTVHQVMALPRSARAVLDTPDRPPAGGDVNSELSFVIHELMSPLTVIEGFATMLEARGGELTPDEVRDYAGRIARQATHLRAMIDVVADARRVAARSLELRTEPVNISCLVTEVVGDLAAVLEPHPVLVDAPGEVVVPADATRIRQVLANLLSNAAKFSPPSSPITVSVEEVPAGAGAAVVSVVDQGRGVPAHRRAELFQRYSRLDATEPGMGIGLYISRGIALAHGGSLLLAPAQPGEGARFVLTLPAAR